MTAPNQPPPESAGPQIQVINLLPVALTVIAVLLALSFFGQVAPSLLAITLALILATALNPLARYFERWMPRAAAGGLTVLVVLLALAGMGFLAIPPVVAQLSTLTGNVPSGTNQLETALNSWLRAHPEIDAVLPDDALSKLGTQFSTWLTKAASSLPSLAAVIIGGVFTAIVTLVMVVFVLGNPVPLVNGFLGAVPPRYRVKATYALAQVLKQLGAWGRATMLIMLVTGVVTAGGFWALGVKNWLVFGILAALGELVPTIGPIVATLPPVLFTLLENPERAVLVLIFVLVFQQLESYVLAPFLVGGAGNLHPLSVTVGILLFGGVFGLVGAFLTVPFLIVIKALYQHFYLRDAPNIPDAVAMALISGHVEQQLDREEEARLEAEKIANEAREAELARQAEAGELDLAAVLEPEQVSEDAVQPPPRPPE